MENDINILKIIGYFIAAIFGGGGAYVAREFKARKSSNSLITKSTCQENIAKMKKEMAQVFMTKEIQKLIDENTILKIREHVADEIGRAKKEIIEAINGREES